MLASFITIVAFSQENKSEQSVVIIAEPFSLLNKGLDIGIGYGYENKS